MGHLVIARRSGGHTVQFVIHLVERSAGDGIADIGARLERPGLAVSLKKRPGRIGITLIFADVQDQPRAEHAAVDSVGYLDCGVVRRTAQGTERTEHESGLYRTWPAHEINAVRVFGRRLGGKRCRDEAWRLPGPEKFLDG